MNPHRLFKVHGLPLKLNKIVECSHSILIQYQRIVFNGNALCSTCIIAGKLSLKLFNLNFINEDR